VFCLGWFLLLITSDATAQIARPSVFALDTAVSVDQTRVIDGGNSTGAILDAVMSVGLGGGFEGMIRPWARRMATGTGRSGLPPSGISGLDRSACALTPA
jgi:hypothetical protein